MWAQKTFIQGERRSVTLTVALEEGSAAMPESPGWELVHLDTGQTEASGVCEIVQDGSSYQLSALIEPKMTGLYRLNISFAIGNEVRRPYLLVKVI